MDSGGKKQIPVFGDTESSQESRKKNVVALLNAAKSDAATQEKIKSKMEKTKKEKVAGGAAPAGACHALRTGAFIASRSHSQRGLTISAVTVIRSRSKDVNGKSPPC
mgnify:CR=1 FL=1